MSPFLFDNARHCQGALPHAYVYNRTTMILYYALWQILTLIGELFFAIMHPRYWRLFLAFQFEYFLHSSYFYVNKRAQGNDVFGFTPIFTAAKVFKTIERWGGQPLQDERLLDLGSGDGRFLLTGVVGKGLVGLGLEMNEKLVAKSQAITNYLGVNAEFFDYDFMTGSWIGYDIIFVAWTTFSPERMVAISEKAVSEMVPGAWFVTLSSPADHPSLLVVHSFKAWFSWGMSKVYIHRRQP